MTPLENDYKVRYDLVRERAPANTQLPYVRVTLGTLEQTLANGSFESNEIKLVYPPEPNYNDRYFLVAQVEANVHRLTFSGDKYLELKSDNGQVTYKAPHWFDRNQDDTADIEPFSLVESSAAKPERNRPVAFVAGTKPKISGKFRARGFPLSGYCMYVRATINGSLHLPQTSCQYTSDDYLTLHPTETEEALPDEIAFFNAQGDNAFEIEWEFKPVSGNHQWKPICTTKHTVYVVKADPISTANELRRETLFNIGCRRANGMGASVSAADIVSAIYGEFTDRKVARVARSSGNLRSEEMNYWKNSSVADVLPTSLYNYGDGRCGAWTRFFIDIIRAQGIDASLYEMRAPQAPLGDAQAAAQAAFGGLTIPANQIPGLNVLYVKNWNLSSGQPFTPTDLDGVPAQGQENPRSLFIDHYLVVHAGKIYDPSYGSAFSNNYTQWEDGAIEGYGIMLTITQNIPPLGLFTSDAKWVWKADPKGTQETIPTLISY